MTADKTRYGRSEASGIRSGNAPLEILDAKAAADYRGRGPKGFQRSDERILEQVCECLTDDPQVDASDISVICSAGLVTLQGTVENRATKHRVEDLVAACPGVKDVANRLQVRVMDPPPSQEQPVVEGDRDQ